MKFPCQKFGFTLIEALVVLSIVAILATMAVPSMRDLLQRNAVRGLQTELVGAFNLARSEAVSRNKVVSICPSTDGVFCGTQSDWSNGWMVFVDDGEGVATADNGEFEGGEVILRLYENKTANIINVLNSSDQGLAGISWNFRGFASSQNEGDDALEIQQGAFAIVCAPQGDASVARGVIVARTGRVYRSVDANGDGVHEKSFSNGNGETQMEELSCS